MKGLHIVQPFFIDGAGERNRTSDLRVTSALLYQLSYSSKTVAIINDA